MKKHWKGGSSSPHMGGGVMKKCYGAVSKSHILWGYGKAHDHHNGGDKV